MNRADRRANKLGRSTASAPLPRNGTEAARAIMAGVASLPKGAGEMTMTLPVDAWKRLAGWLAVAGDEFLPGEDPAPNQAITDGLVGDR